MQTEMESWPERIKKFLGSDFFYYSIIVFFVIEAAWIAVSARYPMAFDENYHFGLIQLYSHQLSPFFHHEPAGASVFGDVTRYPSYLFHYLFSFIYRFLTLFTKNTADQIVILRLLNTALFASGLVVWKKVFRAVGASAPLGHLTLLVLILLPQVPFLAGQINYDNLLFPLVAWAIWLTARLAKHWQNNELPATLLLGWLILALFSSLVKYTFLPIFAALIGYLTVKIWPRRGDFWGAFSKSWGIAPNLLKALLIVGLLVSVGLFIERHGYNIVRYHELVPDCGKVIGTDPCLDYGPWARNFHYAAARGDGFSGNVFKFTGVWAWRMLQQPFFVIRQDYATSAAFLLPEITTGVIFSVGLIALIYYWRRLKKDQRFFGLLASVALVYVAALWLLNFTEYHHFQQYVAIQARYLFLIFPAIFVLLGWGISQLIRSPKIKAVLAMFSILLLLQGGGVLNYVSTTNPSWWWPNAAIINANQTAQKIIDPLLIRRWSVQAK